MSTLLKDNFVKHVCNTNVLYPKYIFAKNFSSVSNNNLRYTQNKFHNTIYNSNVTNQSL